MRAVAVLFLLFTIYSIARLVHDPYITPDSIVYMTGAKNLKLHGDYRICWNHPDVRPIPGCHAITDYPPGYSLIILAAMVIIPDPVNAALVVQSLSIVALYAALWGLCRTLDLRAVTMGLLITWLTMTADWQLVTRAIWTEALFTALCVGVLASMLRWQGTKRDGYLYAAWAMLVASVLIKYMGIGNAVPIVLILWRSPVRWSTRLTVTMGLAALPPALWMLRNVALIGHTSAMQRTGETFMVEKLMKPFEHYGATLGLGVVIAALVIGMAIRLRTRSTVFLMLVVMGHFAAVWLPSLVTQMNALDHRLMFPVTVMLALTVAVSMEGLWLLQRGKKR